MYLIDIPIAGEFFPNDRKPPWFLLFGVFWFIEANACVSCVYGNCGALSTTSVLLLYLFRFIRCIWFEKIRLRLFLQKKYVGVVASLYVCIQFILLLISLAEIVNGCHDHSFINSLLVANWCFMFWRSWHLVIG
eukprot:UN21247